MAIIYVHGIYSHTSMTVLFQVTVLLRPLSYFKPSNRLVVLVLSSQHAVRWRLEVEGLPLGLLVLVQVCLSVFFFSDHAHVSLSREIHFFI